MTEPTNLIRNKKGFTLTELLISVVIGLLIMLIVSAIFVLNQRVVRKSNTKAELTQNARITLDLMAREIRQANEIVTILPVDDFDPNLIAHELQFEDGHQTNFIQYIKYYLSGTNLKRQIIVYYFDTDPSTYVHWDDIDPFPPLGQTTLEDRIIGENFSSLDIFGQGSINIELIMTKNKERVDIKTIINPRNT